MWILWQWGLHPNGPNSFFMENMTQIINHWSLRSPISRQTQIMSWLVVYLPLWKIWKSVGMMKFPIDGKIKFMFQTTNQQIMSLNLTSLRPPHSDSATHHWGLPGVPSNEAWEEWSVSEPVATGWCLGLGHLHMNIYIYILVIYSF